MPKCHEISIVTEHKHNNLAKYQFTTDRKSQLGVRLLITTRFVPIYLFLTSLRLNTDEPYKRRDRLSTSESDVNRRQILTFKVGFRTEKIKNIIMAVDPQDRCLNEAETAD